MSSQEESSAALGTGNSYMGRRYRKSAPDSTLLGLDFDSDLDRDLDSYDDLGEENLCRELTFGPTLSSSEETAVGDRMTMRWNNTEHQLRPKSVFKVKRSKKLGEERSDLDSDNGTSDNTSYDESDITGDVENHVSTALHDGLRKDRQLTSTRPLLATDIRSEEREDVITGARKVCDSEIVTGEDRWTSDDVHDVLCERLDDQGVIDKLLLDENNVDIRCNPQSLNLSSEYTLDDSDNDENDDRTFKHRSDKFTSVPTEKSDGTHSSDKSDGTHSSDKSDGTHSSDKSVKIVKRLHDNSDCTETSNDREDSCDTNTDNVYVESVDASQIIPEGNHQSEERCHGYECSKPCADTSDVLRRQSSGDSAKAGGIRSADSGGQKQQSLGDVSVPTSRCRRAVEGRSLRRNMPCVGFMWLHIFTCLCLQVSASWW
jgi:hypothetical protein